MQAVPGTRTAQEIVGPRSNLALDSIGAPLGGLFVDTVEQARTFWAHEVGHHKHLEHAGDKIGHATNAAQHDRARNSVDPNVAADPDPNSRKWDRDCLMSYVNTDAIDINGVDDRGYFCGKCLLKLRGWKVEGIADPAGNVGGP